MDAAPLRPDNRLFVALDLPADARRALGARGRELAGALAGRPVPEAGLHLTLAFLGRVPPERGPALRGALEEAMTGPAPRLEPVGPVAFPRLSRATVLALELRDAEGALAALHARVGEAVRAALGTAPDERPLRPHVTLVRFRRPARLGPLGPAGVERAFDCSRCALYDSRQVSGGPPRYEALLVAGLGEAGRARGEPRPASVRDPHR